MQFESTYSHSTYRTARSVIELFHILQRVHSCIDQFALCIERSKYKTSRPGGSSQTQCTLYNTIVAISTGLFI